MNIKRYRIRGHTTYTSVNGMKIESVVKTDGPRWHRLKLYVDIPRVDLRIYASASISRTGGPLMYLKPIRATPPVTRLSALGKLYARVTKEAIAMAVELYNRDPVTI